METITLSRYCALGDHYNCVDVTIPSHCACDCHPENKKEHLSTFAMICSKCSKRTAKDKDIKMGSVTLRRYTCGCSEIIKDVAKAKESTIDSISSFSGKTPYKFQKDGVKFTESANGRVLIADEMGLGKTIQALLTMRLHSEMGPFLVITKASLTMQWRHEINEWVFNQELDADSELSDLNKSSLIINDPVMMVKGFGAYICSYDILAERKARESKITGIKKTGGLEKKGENIQDKFVKMGIKTVILDETQTIKNTDAGRTKTVRKICSMMKYVIGLSGTPIKNNAGEYFSILNILHPELFPTEIGFINNYVRVEGMKRLGLKNPEYFAAKTKDFIIRRERKEVLPDLPVITRNYTYHDLGKEVEEAYANMMAEFLKKYDDGEFTGNSMADNMNLLAYLGRMRHLTGLSKVDNCIDAVMEFLGSTDRKLTIFIHHQDVALLIKGKLEGLLAELGINQPLCLTSNLSPEDRDNMIQRFRNDDKNRILLASTLASGEGLNIQFCADCIVVERQWNPANEEQAEGRFIRIGQLLDKVTATYLVAVGTIDEYFASLVEQKRSIFKSTMSGTKMEDWNQTSLLKQLTEILASKGRKQWSF